MSDTIEIANAVSSLRDYIRALVVEAHQYPRYLTPEMQQTAMEDFRSKVELDCFSLAE